MFYRILLFSLQMETDRKQLSTPCLFCWRHSFYQKYLNTSNAHYNQLKELRFEVVMAVTMKNAVFWDVKPYGSCKDRRFGETYRIHHQGEKNQRTSNNVSSN
jgi:hypothetical protein